LDFKDYEDRSRSSKEIIRELRDRLKPVIRGAEWEIEESKEGPPSGPPINLEIAGPDIRELGALADRVRDRIQDVDGLVDLKDNYIDGKPEIVVRIDKEKAAYFGLDALTIATTIKGAINGLKVGVYREGKDEYDILTRVTDKDRHSVESLKRLTIAGANGEPIPVTSVAEFKIQSGLGGIYRKDQKRVVTLSGNNSVRLANEIIAEIDGLLKTFDWPKGYSYQFTGEQEEQRKAQDFLGKAFVIALFLILMVLLAQFNSFAYPMVVLSSVLLSLIGVFGGLLITGKPFGVIMTGIGVISLAGVVVNNAIVLIDFYLQLMGRGLSSREALLTAGITRFRPVMLTAVTTVLGLVPMAVGVSFDFYEFSFSVGGTMTQFWASMAVAVIFGLGVATMLTLVVVPVLCSLVNGAKTRFGWGK
jgi:multidrug efflux pump subunit AcrB